MHEEIKREVKELHRLNSDIQSKTNNYIEDLMRVPERCNIEDLIKSIEYDLEEFKIRNRK